MSEFETRIFELAARKLWHDTAEDKQITSIPARLSPLSGLQHSLDSRITSITLPEPDRRYVVYEIGQTAPALIGIHRILMRWVRMDVLSHYENMVIHLHIRQLMLPAESVYVLRDNDKNILLAVDAGVNHDLLHSGYDLHMHLYSSDWIDLHGGYLTDPIRNIGGYISHVDDGIPILTAITSLPEGNHQVFHNGYYVNDITADEYSVGDTLTYMQDKSGRGYVDMPLATLSHYTSTIDSMEKLLIQMPLLAGDTVRRHEPADELEIYICTVQDDVGIYPRVKGFFYSRISVSDLRMVTYRDFAMSAIRVESLLTEHASDIGTRDPFIRIFLRQHTNGDYDFEDGQYMQDLMRVDIDKRKSLMVGTAGTYQGWRPGNLEQSGALQWQDANVSALSLSALKGVYSLPALNRIAGSAEITNDSIVLPAVMDLGGTLVMFDAEGLFLRHTYISTGSAYTAIPLPDDVHRVQCIPGNGNTHGMGLDLVTGFTDQASYWDEVFYYMLNGTSDWVEAIESIDYHIDVDTGMLEWDDIHNDSGRMRRSIDSHIVRHYDIEPEMLHLPIDIYSDAGPSTQIPLAHLDVYVNGHYCIPGIDFLVDYPKLTITNKEYYLNGAIGDMVRVDVFHYGVPGSYSSDVRYGFTRHHKTRDTDVHIFTELRNTKCVVDGATVDSDMLGLFERPTDVNIAGIREGALYGFIDNQWVLGPWARKRLATDRADTDMHSASGAVSKLIEDVADNTPVYIPRAHALYSPFIKRTILRIRRGDIDVYALGLDVTAVTAAMAPYIHELDDDILSTDIDWDMVEVHPTPNIFQSGVTEEEILFLRIVNDLYCHGRLVFNTYLFVDNNADE